MNGVAAVNDQPPERESSRRPTGLVIGHIVFAPLTALWLCALLSFFVVLVVTIPRLVDVRSHSSGAFDAYVTFVESATPYLGLTYMAYWLALLPGLFLLPMAPSVATSYGLWKRRRWGPKASVVVAVLTIAAICNAFLWDTLYVLSSRRWNPGRFALSQPLPLEFYASFGLPTLCWSVYVLWRTRRFRRVFDLMEKG